MAYKSNIILCTIILIIVVIAVFCFFFFYYTPSKLKQAEKEYEEMKESLEKKNRELASHIKELEERKKDIEDNLLAEKERGRQLEKEIREGERRILRLLSEIQKLTDDEIVINTRIYLNEYLAEKKAEDTEKISEGDIFNTKKNVTWSFRAMKTNYSVLIEHKYLAFTLKPQLEEKCENLENQRDYYSDLYDTQLGITEDRTKMYDNEKALREQCESIYDVCKKQLRSSKVKSFLLGSGLGAALVLIISLVK